MTQCSMIDLYVMLIFMVHATFIVNISKTALRNSAEEVSIRFNIHTSINKNRKYPLVETDC